MSDKPLLPRSLWDWICVFGPGAIMASLTIGTGELIFSSRGGALFGFDILYVFVLILVLKWSLVFATSRHMIFTGVHPYERMIELPGPRGWLPIMMLLMAAVCLPIWISFHSSVTGNLIAWMTGTSSMLNGGMDYVWGLLILGATLALCAVGGYSLLEKIQTVVVLAMVVCAGMTLMLYQPDWLQLLAGIWPHTLSYPEWVPVKYPRIAASSVWVETTRYVGVIGGAGFDYLAYNAWLREKRWGVMPERATPAELAAIAADPSHPVRKWVRAPFLDSVISFALVAIFSTVFVASGAMFLGPRQTVPDEENMLNLQAQFITQIHPWLLPLYLIGAFLTMQGTLYGTIEIACSIADEIARSFDRQWTVAKAHRLKRWVLVWCGSIAISILAWLLWRQAIPGGAESGNGEPPTRVLLTILTPVNLFTGVFSCGLICLLSLWMDQRWLPPALRPPLWLKALNLVSGLIFVSLGLKGYWDNQNRVLAVGGMGMLLVAAWVIAAVRSTKQPLDAVVAVPIQGEQAS